MGITRIRFSKRELDGIVEALEFLLAGDVDATLEGERSEAEIRRVADAMRSASNKAKLLRDRTRRAK